jgi:hypothetical protein
MPKAAGYSPQSLAIHDCREFAGRRFSGVRGSTMEGSIEKFIPSMAELFSRVAAEFP